MFLLREWSFLLFLACLAVSIWSFFRIISVTRHYKNALNSRKKSASEIAAAVLKESGIEDISVVEHSGEMTDHYSPAAKVLHLSSVVFVSQSITSIGIAVHEAGHAIQDREGNQIYRVRNALIPVTNILSYIAMPMFAFGLIADVMWLTHLGEYIFIGLVVYHVFMLPLELDGRKKTMKTMTRKKMLAPDELDDVSEVYQAATLTQLSIALTSIGHLIKLIVLSHKE